MIDPQYSSEDLKIINCMNNTRGKYGQTHHLCRVKVVHGKYGASLVLVAYETETFWLPGVLVSDQIDVDDLTVPGETKYSFNISPIRDCYRIYSAHCENTVITSPSVKS